jgi:hypothetical protein
MSASNVHVYEIAVSGWTSEQLPEGWEHEYGFD